jgi:hypothetical protein
VLPSGLALALSLAFAAGPFAGPAAADSTFTWSGQGANANFSTAGNWSPTAPSSGATALSFGPLAAACDPPASAPTCYRATNDISGLQVDLLSFDDSTPYDIEGNPITLGAGGLTAAPSGGDFEGYLGTPITLGASQTWNVTGPLSLALVTGSAEALTVDMHPPGTQLDLDHGDTEVGPLSIDGRGSIDFNGATGLNATDGSAIDLTGGATMFMDKPGSTGPLSVSGASVDLSSNMLNVNGSVTLDAQDTVGALIASPTGFGQLAATGNVALAGKLDLQQLPVNNACIALPVGTQYPLISTTGALTGTFTNLPDGSMLGTFDTCPRSQGLSTLARVNYTPSAVDVTIVQPPAVAQIRASLSGVLKPTGKNALIPRLLKHHGYTFTLPAVAGRLQLAWQARSGHTLATIANVNVTSSGAAPTKFQIKIVAKGRRLLPRQPKLKVKATATFSPAATQLRAITAHRTFTLKR